MLKHIFVVLLLTFSSLSFAADPININTADAGTIADTLTGVGEAKAEAIVSYRQSHGSYNSVDELILVKGIGEKTVEANRSLMAVE